MKRNGMKVGIVRNHYNICTDSKSQECEIWRLVVRTAAQPLPCRALRFCDDKKKNYQIQILCLQVGFRFWPRSSRLHVWAWSCPLKWSGGCHPHFFPGWGGMYCLTRWMFGSSIFSRPTLPVDLTTMQLAVWLLWVSKLRVSSLCFHDHFICKQAKTVYAILITPVHNLFFQFYIGTFWQNVEFALWSAT